MHEKDPLNCQILLPPTSSLPRLKPVSLTSFRNILFRDERVDHFIYYFIHNSNIKAHLRRELCAKRRWMGQKISLFGVCTV